MRKKCFVLEEPEKAQREMALSSWRLAVAWELHPALQVEWQRQGEVKVLLVPLWEW
jgi:hypothetical protein